MSEASESRVPFWFWIVSGLALAWTLLALFISYTEITRTPESLAASGEWSPEQLDYLLLTPVWVDVTYAIAVLAGVVGSIGLLIRKKWATTMFLIFVIGVLLLLLDGVMRDRFTLMGSRAIIVSVVYTSVAIAWWWFATKADSKGWLR